MAKPSGQALPPEALEKLTALVMQTPLHRFLGLRVTSLEPGRAELRMLTGPNAINLAGMLHGGVTYAILDVVCYLAAASHLEPGTNLVTHDIHVSVMRPVPAGKELVLTGRVVRKGKTLVFCDGEARVDGKLAATARITKTLVEVDLFAGPPPWSE